jgi:protein-tyrosine phosphatase
MEKVIDIHSHILPGVDDGAKNWEETLQMCKIASEAGISHMVATPHFIPGAYTKGVKEGPRLLDELKNRLTEAKIPLEVSLAAEIEPFPEMVQWLEEGRLPLYPSGKHVLVETPFYTYPLWMSDLLTDLIITGITPILAHPERSPFTSLSFIEKAVREGIEIQIDAGSLLGLWGKEIQRMAWEMIGEGWVTYVASDCHKTEVRSPLLLEETRKALTEHMGESTARLLTKDAAQKVITPRCNSSAL